MNRLNSVRRISRRDFLKLAGLTAATAAGLTLLDTYSPWLEYPGKIKPNNQGTDMNKLTDNIYPGLIQAAALAASGHNTQPWKFEILDGEIRIHPDYSRRLPAVDPHDRELWISLGCALENLILAANATGLNALVTYPDVSEFISVSFKPGEIQNNSLFDFIHRRQNTRSVYDGRSLPAADLAVLTALPLEPGTALHFFGDDKFCLLGELIRQGNLSQFADPAFKEELIAWIRFTKKEALASRDGLFSRCSGNPEVPRFLGSMFVSGMKPLAQADADNKKLLSSAGVVVLSSAADSKTDWIRTGQVYERLALTMTGLNIKSAFLNQAIETPSLRPQLQQTLGLGEMSPQLLVRFGKAAEMPPSLRRSVEEVIITY